MPVSLSITLVACHYYFCLNPQQFVQVGGYVASSHFFVSSIFVQVHKHLTRSDFRSVNILRSKYPVCEHFANVHIRSVNILHARISGP